MNNNETKLRALNRKYFGRKFDLIGKNGNWTSTRNINQISKEANVETIGIMDLF